MLQIQRKQAIVAAPAERGLSLPEQERLARELEIGLGEAPSASYASIRRISEGGVTVTSSNTIPLRDGSRRLPSKSIWPVQAIAYRTPGG